MPTNTWRVKREWTCTTVTPSTASSTKRTSAVELVRRSLASMPHRTSRSRVGWGGRAARSDDAAGEIPPRRAREGAGAWGKDDDVGS